VDITVGLSSSPLSSLARLALFLGGRVCVERDFSGRLWPRLEQAMNSKNRSNQWCLYTCDYFFGQTAFNVEITKFTSRVGFDRLY
jgi:hypothetical protein